MFTGLAYALGRYHNSQNTAEQKKQSNQLADRISKDNEQLHKDNERLLERFETLEKKIVTFLEQQSTKDCGKGPRT
jgi:cell division septum initiation protein DivIVA